MTRESDTSLAGARMRGVIPHVPDIADAALGAALQHRLDQKTKPLGSLGRLEALALQLGQIQLPESPA